MSLSLVTHGIIGGVVGGGGGGFVSDYKPSINEIVALQPKVVSAMDLKPKPYDSEDDTQEEFVPTITNAENLKPKITSARNIIPVVYDTEEEE